MAGRFIIYIPLIILLPDLYIWFVSLRSVKSRWRLLHWLPLLLVAASIVGMALSIKVGIFFELLLICVVALYIPKLVFTAVSAIGRVLFSVVRRAASIVDNVALLMSVVAFGCMLYGLTYGWRRITVKNVVVASAKLPAEFDGYRIVQLSDLHLGTFARSAHFVDEVVEKTNLLHPDMICFTGDIVNLHPSELSRFTQTLDRLSAPDGVYSIMGNHDYCAYATESDEASLHESEMLIQMERSMGWNLLLNRNRLLTRGADTLAVIGVENDGEPPFPSYANMHIAMDGVPTNAYKLLLSHNPSHWRREVLDKSDVDLMLAGHTHAMQFRIGCFSPSALKYKEWGGLYESSDGRALYVNTGTGGNFPFRFGAWPEITLITLKRA